MDVSGKLELPSDVEMSKMTFSCGELIYEGNSAGTSLTATALVLEPATLSIAPRDFEKLTPCYRPNHL